MDASIRFLTPPEVARRYGVAPQKVLAWIRSGELAAVNVASCMTGRPRYAVSPAALAEFEAARAARTARRRTARKPRLAATENYFAHL